MKGHLALRKPILTLTLDLSANNITTAAWRQITAALAYACSAVEIFHPSGSNIQMSLGAAAAETTALVPMTILPGGTDGPIALEIPAGKRISMKAIDTTVSSGYLVMNFFQ